jgi:hypothetical protein
MFILNMKDACHEILTANFASCFTWLKNEALLGRLMVNWENLEGLFIDRSHTTQTNTLRGP